MSTSISGQYMSNCYYFSVSETNLLTVYFRVSLSLSLFLSICLSLSLLICRQSLKRKKDYQTKKKFYILFLNCWTIVTYVLLIYIVKICSLVFLPVSWILCHKHVCRYICVNTPVINLGETKKIKFSSQEMIKE